MKKKQDKNLMVRCTNCGNEISIDAPSCPACGQSFEKRGRAAQSTTSPHRSKQLGGTAKNIASAIAAIMLSLLVLVSIIASFFHYLAMLYAIPTLGNMDGDWITNVLVSPYPLLLSGMLIVLIMALLILINISKVRRFFLFCGIAFVIDCGLNCVLAFYSGPLVKIFSGDLQDILVNTTGAFTDLLTLCTLALAALSAVMISIYASITAARGDVYEKDN